MKNARTIGFGILGALACTVALMGGCATDEAATTDSACSDAATCSGEAKTCSGEAKACCADKAAAKECCAEKAAAQDAAKN